MVKPIKETVSGSEAPGAGAGLASYLLTLSLFATLENKGILTSDDIKELFVDVISGSEEIGLFQTPEGKSAYELLCHALVMADDEPKQPH